MRWEDLFADLEGQLERELDIERQELAAEEERLRLARLELRDRVLAMGCDGMLHLVLADGESVVVDVGTAGRDWIAGELLRGVVRHPVVIPLAAIAAVLPQGTQLVSGLGAAEPPREVGQAPLDGPRPALADRVGLAVVLRDLCRRRVAVELRTRVGTVHGTIDRVSRDHLDLAEHDPGEPRRDAAVRRIRLVPFSSLLSVRA